MLVDILGEALVVPTLLLVVEKGKILVHIAPASNNLSVSEGLTKA
jgi:hypothetical protein